MACTFRFGTPLRVNPLPTSWKPVSSRDFCQAGPWRTERASLLFALAFCVALTSGFFLLRTLGRRTDPIPPVAKSAFAQPVLTQPEIQEEPAEPVSPATHHQISWGDTLWRIAERYYGDRGLYRKLAESNALDDPDRIIAGESLVLPPALENRQRYDDER